MLGVLRPPLSRANDSPSRWDCVPYAASREGRLVGRRDDISFKRNRNEVGPRTDPFETGSSLPAESTPPRSDEPSTPPPADAAIRTRYETEDGLWSDHRSPSYDDRSDYSETYPSSDPSSGAKTNERARDRQSGKNGRDDEPAETVSGNRRDPNNPLPAYLTGKNYPKIAQRPREESVHFPARLLDADAVKVVRRLTRNGHTAYFVGGCVRDLLLDRTPKDFDIGTSARPRQVKKLFRNCWIIGRRFKLAHVNFGTKTVEVSTFRAFLPETFDSDRQDLLIRRDNLFGNPAEDACRRDFTINGLFYDLERGIILDHIGGLEDIEGRIIRTIGDPEVRLREDPVRILRAIKFASRLSFDIDPTTYEAMVRYAPDIARCAPPRVLEEILRILRGGAAANAFEFLVDTDVLQVLFPEIDEGLRRQPGVLERYQRLFHRLDALTLSGQTPSTGLCLACLFLPVVEELDEPEAAPTVRWDSVSRRLDDMLASFGPRLNVPRRDCGRLRDIVNLQRRLRPRETRRRPTRASIARNPCFIDALEVFRADSEAERSWATEVERWDSAAEKVRAEGRNGDPRGHGKAAPGRRANRNSRGGSSRNESAPSGNRSRRRRRRPRPPRR